MTKRVRIENADMSSFKVLVQVWDKGHPGSDDMPASPDTLAHEIILANPADMTDANLYLTSTRYLIVKEA